MQAVGQPFGVADKTGAARIVADANKDALARRPRALDGARLHLGEQLLVYALGGAAQSNFAERGKVRRRKEILERALGLLGNVDFAFLQALNQIVRREVDQLNGVGPIEHGVRHRLAYAHMRNLRDDVVEAFDVLDIDRSVDVDAVAHQLLDIEIALRVPAAFDVGMRKFVDQHDLRPPGDDGVEVHLVEHLSFIADTPPRNDFQTLQQRLGLPAAVRLHDAGDDVVAVFFAGVRLLQHLVGLADARRGADENPEFADAPSSRRAASSRASGEGRLFGRAPLIRHHRSDLSSLATLRRALAGRKLVEREIEQQYIDARLAQDTEQAILDIVADKLPHAIFGQVAGLGNSRDLEVGGLRRDVRVEAAAGRGHQIDRDGSAGILLPSVSRSA